MYAVSEVEKQLAAGNSTLQKEIDDIIASINARL